MKNKTDNGVEYTESLTSINGASFVLYPNTTHSKEDIKQAKAQLRAERDIVHMRLADKYDIADDYWGKIFKIGDKKHKLHWSQMDYGSLKKLYKFYKAGITPKQYVAEHLEEWKKIKIQKL